MIALAAAPQAVKSSEAPGAIKPSSAEPQISVIVPVYNGESTLPACLEALTQSRSVSFELIVVDDGSTDSTPTIASSFGARVVNSNFPRSGPGQARNVGAGFANAPILCFIDADVVVQPDTLSRFMSLFENDLALSAAFGSYDAKPSHPSFLSQYRNLLHHFVHQTGQEAASTFWAGCGAIRREAFTSLGGFEPLYDRPCIEDIALGYRLRAAGRPIRLAKDIQVKHLKRWTLKGMVRTDIYDRALPWTALIVRTKTLPNDLNLNSSSRTSAVSVFALAGSLMLAWWAPALWAVALVSLALLVTLNRQLYRFFLRERGPWFMLRVLPVHWLYYAYSSLAFAFGMFSAKVLSADGGSAKMPAT
jgi:glycosyltransferase involved in cell wall biosynthesis